MWIGYMQEILFDGKPIDRAVTAESIGSKICSADFHGAKVEVVRSRCVSRVGVKGIIVKDLRHVFEVVTEKNGVKVLPKEGTVFRIVVPLVEKEKGIGESVEDKAGGKSETKECVFEVHGDQFIYRAADRANRKFKSHYLKSL
jgi:ribonuclease P protein subunit POP4